MIAPTELTDAPVKLTLQTKQRLTAYRAKLDAEQNGVRNFSYGAAIEYLLDKVGFKFVSKPNPEGNDHE